MAERDSRLRALVAEETYLRTKLTASKGDYQVFRDDEEGLGPARLFALEGMRAAGGTVSAGWGRPWRCGEARLYLAIFAIALVLRVGTVAYLNGFYSSFLFAPDSHLYDGLASSLVAGEGYAIDRDHREYTRITPVFPVYLALLYLVFGRGVVIVGLANAVLGSLTCLVVYGFGRKLLSRWAEVQCSRQQDPLS